MENVIDGGRDSKGFSHFASQRRERLRIRKGIDTDTE